MRTPYEHLRAGAAVAVGRPRPADRVPPDRQRWQPVVCPLPNRGTIAVRRPTNSADAKVLARQCARVDQHRVNAVESAQRRGPQRKHAVVIAQSTRQRACKALPRGANCLGGRHQSSGGGHVDVAGGGADRRGTDDLRERAAVAVTFHRSRRKRAWPRGGNHVRTGGLRCQLRFVLRPGAPMRPRFDRPGQLQEKVDRERGPRLGGGVGGRGRHGQPGVGDTWAEAVFETSAKTWLIVDNDRCRGSDGRQSHPQQRSPRQRDTESRRRGGQRDEAPSEHLRVAGKIDQTTIDCAGRVLTFRRLDDRA